MMDQKARRTLPLGRLRHLGILLLVAAVAAACSRTEATLHQPDMLPAASADRPPSETPEPPPIQAGIAPPPGPYAPGFDAIHYDVALTFPDTSSYVRGRAQATIERAPDAPDSLSLDFSGLAVKAVEFDGEPVAFRFASGKLWVPVAERAGERFEVSVSYGGHPDDGLIIGRNRHGSPTAFADNWPNRARFWFPSIDHPSDKASVTFTVELPAGDERSVISNGRLDPASADGTWIWSTDIPIPTYTMVVGVADFVVDTVGSACSPAGCVEVTTWLYPQDRSQASPSFARAADMVTFYDSLIAPFPYEKLAHVQSSTRFGGMENVSAIFYSDEALSRGIDMESTVAHETAHQWFGDAVTEADWHHLWLSEGFATYFGALFFEFADGVERFAAMMEESRTQYIQSSAPQKPIIDPNESNLFRLLNANNYQKGGWVLHMLRRQLGDEAFFRGIRSYYREFEHETALTEDLQRHLEESSGVDLDAFFRQWLFEPGHPVLRLEWTSDGEVLEGTVHQTQDPTWPTFAFPLTLEIGTGGATRREVVDVHQREQAFRLDVAGRVTSVVVDPDGDLLKEVVSVEERR